MAKVGAAVSGEVRGEDAEPVAGDAFDVAAPDIPRIAHAAAMEQDYGRPVPHLEVSDRPLHDARRAHRYALSPSRDSPDSAPV